MKLKLVSVLTLFLGFSGTVSAQITGIGIQPKMNFARQLNVNKQLPFSQSRSVEGLLAAPGVDVFGDYRLSEKWLLRGKLGVETKGYVSSTPTLDFDSRVMKFHYASTDFSVQRSIGTKKVRQYLFTGLSLGYLVKKETEQDFTSFSLFEYESVDFTDYAKWNFGFVAGVGVSFEDKLWLELEYNRDLISPLEKQTRKISNYVYSVNVGVNLLKLLQK